METQAVDGVKLFIPETYDIFWSAVVLVVVAVFFYKFFLPKFQAIFDERAAKIEGGIAKAEKAQADADAAKKKYEDQLNTARVDAAKIRDDARTEASHIIADARVKAEADAAQITANAQKSIESQQQQALVSLKGEVGALATALAGKILGSKLQDADVQTSMLDSMIEDIDKDSAGKAK
ncbi:F0F1 ATP synthase subunit B [Bifidobacterium simiarum]|uniref:ATP synthase subunit b n=1 Tax=Bifidobacterium simiarum TaxID=2045441 RepID=A0A2M9HDK6_9BIFI|nr:F0F1 ATP synthase subunit B [Bifidobacterium simiarum]PJM74900.1 F0F1 ATP synthase subunit B [Bifidobacterium simiarum]